MMIGAEYARTMARYNAWQNGSLIAAADSLDDAARRLDRGAFFSSIFLTFNHLLWGDRMWLSRFTDSAPPPGRGIEGSLNITPDWETFKAARAETDAVIADWVGSLTDADLAGDLSWYSGAAGRDMTQPINLLVMQFFNHQTHHRGQIHAMLTAAGVRPDDTDLPFMPKA